MPIISKEFLQKIAQDRLDEFFYYREECDKVVLKSSYKIDSFIFEQNKKPDILSGFSVKLSVSYSPYS